MLITAQDLCHLSGLQVSRTNTPLASRSSCKVLAHQPALFDWRTPSLEELLAILAMAAFSALGQTCVVYALRAGDVTAVTPFEYSRLLRAVAFSYLLFAEVPAASIWTGGAIIVASMLYIGLREARLARQRRENRASGNG